ncbi:MAG: hypothetical protein ABIV13_01160 [Fimbriimonadales bacterium]
MGKRGRVTIIEATPGFEGIRRAVSDSLGRRGLTVVSSSTGVLLRIQEAFAGDDYFKQLQEGGLVDLVTVAELVAKLCASAMVPTMPTLDLERQAALIGRVAQDLPDDSAFGGSKHLPGFYEAAAKTLQEMRHERISPASFEMPEGKLQEVALLQEGLKAELERRSYCTLSDRIEDLMAATPTRAQGLRSVLWLPEDEWPKLRLELLDWMIRAGIDLQMLCESHPGNAGFFRSPLYEALPAAEVQRIGTTPTPGARLFSKDTGLGFSGRLRILEASDEFIEVEWALREARLRMRNDGLEASSIVIFAKSLENYGPLLRSAADREVMPLAIDYSETLIAHPFARYVLGALQATVRNGVGPIVELVRSDYSQIPRSVRDRIEETVRGLATEPDVWKAVAAAAKEGELPAWLGVLTEWRRNALDGQRKPTDWLHGLNILVAGCPWLSTTSPREESVNDALVRSIHVALLSLDPVATMWLPEFIAFAERTWSAAEYRVRAQGGVRVVSDPRLIGNAKCVMAIGMIEGRYPSRRAEDPILLDRDRATLREMNSDYVLADSYERALEDERDFYRLLCSCDDITLSFPATVVSEPQDRAGYLLDIEKLNGVEFEKRTFAQRFPKADECITDRELVGAATKYRDFGNAPSETTTKRVRGLLEAHVASRNTELEDDIVKAKLGVLPQPIRMAHFRSLSQCPFQYFARHKLGIRSRKGDPKNSVIVNAIRRSNFNVDSEEAFRTALAKGLNEELLSLQGVLDQHELQVIRCSAPTTLDQFAEVEFKARSSWGLTPEIVCPKDEATGLRQSATFGGNKVSLSPSIDVLYRQDGTGALVPMRIGWETEDTKNESYLVMMMHPGETKSMIFDSYNHGRRKFFTRRTDSRRESPGGKGNLSADVGPNDLRELQKSVSAWAGDLLNKAKGGMPIATPSWDPCMRCDLGSFCRAAPFSDPTINWSRKADDEPAEEADEV